MLGQISVMVGAEASWASVKPEISEASPGMAISGLTRRLIAHLAVLVQDGDLNDLEAPMLQLPCRFRIQQQKRRPLVKKRLQLRFDLKPRIDPAKIDAAGNAVAMLLAIAEGIIDAGIAVLLEPTRRVFTAAALAGMLLGECGPRFDERGQLLVRCFSMWHTVLPLFRVTSRANTPSHAYCSPSSVG